MRPRNTYCDSRSPRQAPDAQLIYSRHNRKDVTAIVTAFHDINVSLALNQQQNSFGME